MKKKLLAYISGLLVIAGTVVALNLSQPAFAGDCDDNAIIRCGTSSINALRSDVSKSGELQAIFAHYGMPSSVINGATVKTGSVTKAGNIVVDGKTVATNAQSVGRQNMAGSSAVKIAGKTYYQRPTSVSFRSSALQAFVFYNSQGQVIGAVLLACGNPVVAKPVPQPKPPVAACGTIGIRSMGNGQFGFAASASADNGAKITAYHFTITSLNGQVTRKTWTVNSSATSVATQNSVDKPGAYRISFYVSTTIGDRGDAKCATDFTYSVPQQPVPGVEVNKLVDGVEHKTVGINQEFTYQIAVKNTGATVLTDTIVTDNAPEGVTFVSASAGTATNTKWTYTIPSLARGEIKNFTITAKVPAYKAGTIKNTVCVDAPATPTNPDDCDDATIETDEPKISINKLVDGVEHKTVGINQEFTYQIAVKNEGNTVLKNAVVTDKAPSGVTFVSASAGSIANSEWKLTIAELKIGETKTYTIKAKLPAYKAGTIKNTVCVDTPEIPGYPDDCDDATIDTTEPTIPVCKLDDKTIITIKESEFDSSKHSKNLEDCKTVVVKIPVCKLADKTIIIINESEFDSSKHSKNLNDCKEVMIPVCKLDDKTIITIKESEFDSSKHSKDLNDCKPTPAPEKMIVCELDTKKIIEIEKTAFDETKHSTDLNKCAVTVVKVPVCDATTGNIITVKETEKDNYKPVDDEACKTPTTPTQEPETQTPETPAAPQVIASTGPETIIGGLLGSSALGIGISSFVRSRRALRDTL